MEYRWRLRKGSHKEICPACGQRRFVPYVAAADGTTMAGAEYGRCDRESSCGYNRYPSGKKTDGIEPKPQPKLQPIRFYPGAVVTDYKTPLFEWAAKLMGTYRAIEAWNAYKVGADCKRTVFWQIAADGTIRGGKSIPYLNNGHRDKTDKYPASWLHKAPAYRGMFEGQELQQCFFGEHLLTKHPEAKVAIVESEKTALIMSRYSPNTVWLACGGSQGLKNKERNKVLEGRHVILVPDNGQFWNWIATADEYGWDIRAELELHPIFPGCDILDMFEIAIKTKKDQEK